MKLYCQSCGTPHEYSIKKPNFCQGCGFQFNKTIAKVAETPVIKPKFAIEADDDDDEYEEAQNQPDSVPDIKDLDVDIEVTPQRGIKLGEIAGTAGGSEKFERENESPVSKEDFLKEFKREAGSIRPNKRSKKS